MNGEGRSIVGGPFLCRTCVLILRNMTNNKPGATQVNTSTLWAGFGVFVAVLVAGVALSATGMDTPGIIALLTGLVAIVGTMLAALDRLTTVHRINAEQSQQIEVIDQRTNGGLEPRIQSAVSAALDARFGPPLTSADTQPVTAGQDGE